jgi:transmembrane sensor
MKGKNLPFLCSIIKTPFVPEFPPTLETLLLDQSFINYCLLKDVEAAAYWKAVEQAHPEYGEVLGMACQYVKGMYAWGEGEEMDQQWNKLQESISVRQEEAVYQALIPIPERRLWFRGIAWTAGAAAAVAGTMMVIGLSTHKVKQTASIPYLTISAPGPQVRECGLPDGSIVWLDAGSTIRYRQDEEGSRKIVLMEGQIFCKVKHDSTHRFSVHTPAGLDINDIGTAFSVQSYAGLHQEVIRVLEGEVNVQKANSNVSGLNKGEGIVLDDLTGEMTRLYGITVGDTSWISGRIELSDVTFAEMAIVLERTFGLHISFTNPELMKYKASTSFRRTDPQSDVLEALKLVYGITYTMKGSSVVLHGMPEHR